MPSALKEKSYVDYSLDDFETRGKELRTELFDLNAGERGASFLEDKRALLDEAAVFDAAFGIALRQADKQGIRHIPGQHEVNIDAILKAAGIEGGIGTLAAHRSAPTGEYRTGGDRILQADGMREWIDRGLPGGSNAVGMQFELDHCSINDFWMGMRAAYPEYGTGGPGNAASSGVSSLLPVGQPIAPTARRAMLFMRDLIPVQPTTLSQVPYVRELTPTSTEGGVTSVAEGNLKPDTTDQFTPDIAYITVLAGNVSPTKQLWEDAPVVAAYINQRLPYKVKFREDAQILSGSGTFPDIKGIKNFSGVQSQSAVSGEYAITIGMAIAKIENVDAEATAVVMNPTDAWTMFTKRASGGSGTFDAGTPFDAIPLTVWGLPTKRSRAYAAGSALVGDFQGGAMILDRESMNVQIYPQHSDYAARNQILVQAEERIGLAVWRPDSFVTAGLS